MIPDEGATITRNVVRSVVFSIFIAGCLTDEADQRAYLLSRLDAQSKERVGNCFEVGLVMKEVWRERGNRKHEPVPWQEALGKSGMLLV
jgi:hypothetical protein